MKEILDEESKNALINYRIQRAYETLKEAQVMMRESFYNAAVNRLYYACYYAAVSLLLKYDHQPQTHIMELRLCLDYILSLPESFL